MGRHTPQVRPFHSQAGLSSSGATAGGSYVSHADSPNSCCQRCCIPPATMAVKPANTHMGPARVVLQISGYPANVDMIIL